MYSVHNSAVQCLLWASTVDSNAMGQVEQKAPLSYQWVAPMLGGAVTSDKHRRRAKVSLVELERSIEEVRGWPGSV